MSTLISLQATTSAPLPIITSTLLGGVNRGLVVPLTTIFTPPCYSYVRVADGIDTCGPPDMLSVWAYHGYYSPGICPAGYTHGCTRSTTDDWHPWPIASGETAVSCVPTGFTCITWTPTNDASSADGPTPSYAPAFEIRWKESDLSLLRAASGQEQSSAPVTTSALDQPSPSRLLTAYGLTTFSTSTSAPARENATDQFTPNIAPSASLPDNYRDLIIAGATASTFAAVVAILYLIRRQRRKTRAAQADALAISKMGPGKPDPPPHEHAGPGSYPNMATAPGTLAAWPHPERYTVDGHRGPAQQFPVLFTSAVGPVSPMTSEFQPDGSAGGSTYPEYPWAAWDPRRADHGLARGSQPAVCYSYGMPELDSEPLSPIGVIPVELPLSPISGSRA